MSSNSFSSLVVVVWLVVGLVVFFIVHDVMGGSGRTFRLNIYLFLFCL